MCFEKVYNMLDIWFDTINIIGDICWKTLSLFWRLHVFLDQFSICRYLQKCLRICLSRWRSDYRALIGWNIERISPRICIWRLKNLSTIQIWLHPLKSTFRESWLGRSMKFDKKTVRLKDQNRHFMKTLLMACTNLKLVISL